ncbi:MAG: hypothetical protein NVS3B20_12750 [Polyangiales bacterium]
MKRLLSIAFTATVLGCSSGTPPCTDCGTQSADTGLANDTSVPADTLESPDGASLDAVDGPPSTQDSVAVGDASLTAARPYHTKIPASYDKSKPTPLVILLHGYGGSGALQESYFKLGDVGKTKTFLLAYPDGTLDKDSRLFWNATDACCDFGPKAPNDVAYVSAIIDYMSSNYNVDPKRIFIVGHSNGGFMAHRLACDLSNRVAAIVSLAGAVWKDTAKCNPKEPVAVLQVHGDKDAVVSYLGGPFTAGGPVYPGARETVADWATKDGCGPTLNATTERLHLDSSQLGMETRVERYAGCKGGAVELWTIEGGGHIPSLVPSWADTIYAFLSAHPKP